MDRLTTLIYHEKQQPGSMLCAQHALNSLLQGNFFTAPDLSHIASSLDVLEESYDHANTGSKSTNMDDTGFFSVQVLENALNVWGLSLIRWRSEQMRPYQDHPHTQLAFILNSNQHWFTLRRFGHADPSIDTDPGTGHWFNLNSSLNSPEWVGKLYLGMVLQQAESEGYSVFAVVQADPNGPLALNRTEADEVASTLPEPSRSTVSRLSTSRHSTTPASGSGAEMAVVDGFEDEDMQLQAALQASLMGGATEFSIPLHSSSGSSSSSGSGLTSHTGVRTPTQQGSLPPMTAHPPFDFQRLDIPPRVFPAPPHLSADPVAASMARNRMIMERMRREQEMALSEQYEDEVTRIQAADTSASRTARGARQSRAEEEEEEELVRRAIEASQAETGSSGSSPVVIDDDDDDYVAADEEMDVDIDSDEEEYNLPMDRRPPLQAAAAPVPPVPSYSTHRVYDDDDAELQAALKASLESAPEGFTIPDIPPLPVPPPPPMPTPAPNLSAPSRRGAEDDEARSEVSVEAPLQEEQLSVDEVRRRRLARFGG